MRAARPSTKLLSVTTTSSFPTKVVILGCAVRIIEEHGEAALRIADITSETGVSISSIYHFFGDREGLVAAAQVQRYGASLLGIVRMMESMATSASSADEFRELVLAMHASSFDSERATGHLQRLNGLGSTIGRPELAERIAQIQDDVVRSAASALRIPQAKGWIREDVQIEALVAWTIGQITSRAFIELGETSVSPKAWDALADDAVVAVYFGS